MMRTLIDKMRRVVLGPNLSAFARMPKADLHQLLNLGSDELLFFDQSDEQRAQKLPQAGQGSLPASVQKELEELRAEMAQLKERLSVLERINYPERMTSTTKE
jgi:hypothetical protein